MAAKYGIIAHMAEGPNNNLNDNLTPQKLEFGYWIATHKPELRKAGVVLLAVIAGISVLAFLYQAAVFLIGIPSARAVQQALLTDPINYGARSRPEAIIVDKAEAVVRTDSTIDVFVQVTNPNDSWAATVFEYDVLVGSVSAGRDTAIIAPGQTAYFTRMSVPLAAEDAPSVSVEVLNTEWINYPIAKLPNEVWEASGDVFKSIRNTDDETATFFSELTFTLKNKSVYGFVAPEVIVLLTDPEGDVIAIGSSTPNSIDSLEERVLTYRWPKRFSGALQTEVYVTVDKISEESIITD